MAEMTAAEAAEWGKTLDFPTVWATIIKMGEKVDKAAEAVDRLTENLKKTDENLKELAETVKKMGEKVDKTAETVDKLSKNVGGLNGSMGELIETLFGPHICEKFDAYQYNLERVFKRVPIYDDTSRRRGEIDLLLSNTTVCMVLEVKRWLDNPEKVNEHIKRMELVRQYPPAEIKGKKILGAIAGAVVTPEVREYAEASGFFVLELAGDDVQLLESPENFQAKER